MQCNRLLDSFFNLFLSLARRHAPGKIRDIRGEVRTGVLNHDGVSLHGRPPSHLQPAWRKMLASVPGGIVSLGLPETVTRPGLVGCLNWRWPPLAFTCTQPSERSRRNTSRTFMAAVYATTP